MSNCSNEVDCIFRDQIRRNCEHRMKIDQVKFRLSLKSTKIQRDDPIDDDQLELMELNREESEHQSLSDIISILNSVVSSNMPSTSKKSTINYIISQERDKLTIEQIQALEKLII